MRKIARRPAAVSAGLLILVCGSVVSAGSASAGAGARATTPVVHETLIDPASPDSNVTAINDLGDVVGTDDSGAYLRDAGGVHVLAPPRSGRTSPVRSSWT
jgi:hypothetical protein